MTLAGEESTEIRDQPTVLDTRYFVRGGLDVTSQRFDFDRQARERSRAWVARSLPNGATPNASFSGLPAEQLVPAEDRRHPKAFELTPEGPDSLRPAVSAGGGAAKVSYSGRTLQLGEKVGIVVAHRYLQLTPPVPATVIRHDRETALSFDQSNDEGRIPRPGQGRAGKARSDRMSASGLHEHMFV